MVTIFFCDGLALLQRFSHQCSSLCQPLDRLHRHLYLLLLIPYSSSDVVFFLFFCFSNTVYRQIIDTIRMRSFSSSGLLFCGSHFLSQLGEIRILGWRERLCGPRSYNLYAFIHGCLEVPSTIKISLCSGKSIVADQIQIPQKPKSPHSVRNFFL